MRILIVGGMFPPLRTGTAFYTQNIALALQGKGHNVEVVTLGEADSESEVGLKVHRLSSFSLPMKNFFKYFRLCAWNPANWWRLYRIARNSDAQVILLVNHYLDIAFPTRFVALICKIPLVCSIGTQLQSLNPRRNRILNILDRLICGLLVFPGCERIVAWDAQIHQYLVDVQGEEILSKISIVNYGVNGDPTQLLAHQHDYSDNDTILGVGAVSEQRSFVPLVKAFALLAEHNPFLRLRIIGHIYYEKAPQLAKKLGLENKVEFLGEQPHHRVIEEMQGSSLLYSSLTGQYVGLGTATIEAMLLALPTVVNVPLDLLGKGIIIDKEHLVQCCSSDPAVISQHIELLLGDANLRQKVGKGGRALVQKHLNWDVVALEMSKVLEQVCKDKT